MNDDPVGLWCSSFIVHRSSFLRPPPPRSDCRGSHSQSTRRKEPPPGSGRSSVCPSVRAVAASPRLPWRARSELLHALVRPPVRRRSILQRLLQLPGIEAVLIDLAGASLFGKCVASAEGNFLLLPTESTGRGG